MSKKLWAINTAITTLMVALLLSACGGTKAKTVAEQAINLQIEAVVKSYPEKGDFAPLYELLSAEDKGEITADNLKSMYKLPAGIQEIFDLFPEAKEVVKADDFQEVVTGERAEVMFSLQLPDASALGQGVLSVEDLMKISEGKFKSLSNLPDDIKEKLKAEVAKNGIPTIKLPKTITMVREDEEWKVYINLKEHLPNIPTPFELQSEK